MEGGSHSEEEAANLLDRFEQILESDPLIDEIGFIHPSQFVTLDKEIDGPGNDGCGEQQMEDGVSRSNINTSFWNRDHKLGISTEVLLPLYKAAKDAFLAAFGRYKMRSHLSREYGGECISRIGLPSDNALESEVMKHSRVLLLLSCDFGTSWNARKLILSKRQQLSVFMDELLLSGVVLSYSPKSEQTWSHRRWIIKMIAVKFSCLQEIVGKESELVEKIAERSKMNYRAWNHRCWLVSNMTREQVIYELKKSKDWAGLHVADSSCFHYRRRLMVKLLEYHNKLGTGFPDTQVEAYQIWKEELEWNKQLIKRYVGREALWLHRRFLSVCWMRHFLGNSESGSLPTFMVAETDLVNSCSYSSDDGFDDFKAQALHATTYILWLTKQSPELWKTIIREKFGVESLKDLLSLTYPERNSLWNHLQDIFDNFNGST